MIDEIADLRVPIRLNTAQLPLSSNLESAKLGGAAWDISNYHQDTASPACVAPDAAVGPEALLMFRQTGP